MRKIIKNLILLIFLIFITITIILSTIGIETDKFNNLISERISNEKNIDIDLNTIRFKIDPKEISLFLETNNPKINFKDILVPVENVKVYIDFLSILKTNPKIKKIALNFKELNIVQLNKFSKIIKPSNFKSFLKNKIKKGKLKSEIEIFINENGKLKNFIAKGKVNNLDVQLIDDLNFSNGNLNFFADKDDILIKNIYGVLDDIQVSDGDIKIDLEKGIKLSSNFDSKINFKEKDLNKYNKYIKKINLPGTIKNLDASLNNDLNISFDNTYKIIDYKYIISGKLKNTQFKLNKNIENNFIKNKIENVYFSEFSVKSIFKPKNFNFNGNGNYSFNNKDFLKININNNFKKDFVNLKLDFNYKGNFEIDLINFKKSNNSTASISINLTKKKNNLYIDKFAFKEDKKIINIIGLKLKNNIFQTFKSIEVNTNKNKFTINNNKKILIKGEKFDATNLFKFQKSKINNNFLKNINNKIEIDFENVKAPLSENLNNFKLIGEIKNGQFIKIVSKGDFGGNNFLDISMKKRDGSDKKYLEIYSDLTRPLLTEYSFFQGLSGGKLIYNSIIQGSNSSSKLKIENFKVINAPGVVKLLSLADLSGLKDLAEGDGLSFDVLEIEMEKDKDFLKLNEILALGPSLSVLMEGYQSTDGLTSLRGTLVPAKTLNKIISKIPVIGKIVIPKEIGEGLFGISFKMKGPKGEIKTTINPIRTLTPRFIQKIIDKKNTR